MSNPMPSFMIGKFVDEDIYTVHVLKGNTYYLLAEFPLSQKEQTIEQLKDKYPIIANKLSHYQGGRL